MEEKIRKLYGQPIRYDATPIFPIVRREEREITPEYEAYLKAKYDLYKATSNNDNYFPFLFGMLIAMMLLLILFGGN